MNENFKDIYIFSEKLSIKRCYIVRKKNYFAILGYYSLKILVNNCWI